MADMHARKRKMSPLDPHLMTCSARIISRSIGLGIVHAVVCVNNTTYKHFGGTKGVFQALKADTTLDNDNSAFFVFAMEAVFV